MDNTQNEQGGEVELLTAAQVAEMYEGHSDGKNDIAIDALGRIRSLRREDTDAGVSLRKRRAWYT